ncbi:hypothetical protein ACQJBY_009643 [Aegilops geniculata]
MAKASSSSYKSHLFLFPFLRLHSLLPDLELLPGPPSMPRMPSLALARRVLLLLLAARLAGADDPYRYFTWTVTYGPINPLGTTQQGILINGQFPGPRIDCVTNDNLIVNVVNNLDEPFLITWNGIKQRKNSWQDGVAGTNCPIPPGANYTYKFQAKDQIGTFTYFPSVALHRAAGGFGALNVYQRPAIPVPYPPPAGDFTLLVGDWYLAGHDQLRQTLDSGAPLPFPDALLINGMPSATLVGDQGRTYLLRVSNIGMKTSINFRIQGHALKLAEVEGTHPVQNVYDSLDVHVGQSVAFLVTLDQPAMDYAVVASTRFNPADTSPLTAVGTLHYSSATSLAPGPLPAGPLRHYPDVEDAGLGQLRCRRRWAETVRRERRLVRRPEHASEAPGQLQHRKRDRMGQCPGAARRRGTPARDAGGEAQPARVRRGGVPEHGERDAVVAS